MCLALLLCKSVRMLQVNNQQKNNPEDTVGVAAQRMAEIFVALLDQARGQQEHSQATRKTNEEKNKYKDIL